MKPRIKSVIRNIRKKIQKENNQNNNKKESKKTRDLQDKFKCSNTHIIGQPEGEEEEQEIGNLLEKIMKKNFPNLVKEIDMQVQKAQSPNQMDAKRPTPRHFIIKMS